VREILNLIVDLDDRFRAGEFVEEKHVDETTLAWIDATFGGWWSSEVSVSTAVVARDAKGPLGFAAFDPSRLRFGWLRGLATAHDVGVFGPFGVEPTARGTLLGPALLHAALAGLYQRGYARALIPAVGDERLVAYYVRHAGARVAERFPAAPFVTPGIRTTLMASGSGTNVQAVLDAVAAGRLPLEIVSLVSNRSDAYAIERARRANVPEIEVAEWNRRETPRAEYDARLLERVSAHEPELVLLLGWMHLLDADFVRRFPDLLNVHPAFLPLDPSRDRVGLPDGSTIPAFRGPYAVRDALAAGSTWTGATVHRVTPETDRGPVFTRRPLAIEPGEDEAAILARLHPLEHQLVEGAIRRWIYERDAE
jgi:phosphoribosylglycinamide formyltransferase-1